MTSGWAKGANSHLYHWFPGERDDKSSVCDRVFKAGTIVSTGFDKRPMDCPDCWKRLAELGYVTKRGATEKPK